MSASIAYMILYTPPHVAYYPVAIDFAPNISSVPLDASSDFVYGFTTRIYHTGEINGMSYVAAVDRHQGETRKRHYTLIVS